MWWFVAYTIAHDNDETEDTWEPHRTEATAKAAYNRALKFDNLYCACMGRIAEATEPHWKDDA